LSFRNAAPTLQCPQLQGRNRSAVRPGEPNAESGSTWSIETIRAARLVLDQLETIWRQRLDRFEEILAEPTEGAAS
jgi:hypothetical protein